MIPAEQTASAVPTSDQAPTASLLVELLTEELPPKALRKLSEAFADAIASRLAERGLTAASGAPSVFATPRRLAVRVDAVLAQAPDRRVELKGPSVKVGLDGSGQPSQALLKWAEKQSVAVSALRRAHDGKQECFYADQSLTGDRLADVIGPIIGEALGRLPIPKLMQYQLADGVTNVHFVRPAHGLIVLHGDHVLPASVLGLPSGRATRGHRFQSSGPITIERAQAYETTLERDGRVLAGFQARRERIAAGLRGQAEVLGASLGDEASVDTLLDEVTALVEWPAIYVGRFESEFLQVPQECLILTMRTNQKYFPLFDAHGHLLPEFLIVSNMEVPDPRFIIDGNQRVVRPRLADARFFFDQDRKTRLDARLPQLASVVYHARLGTQAQRSERVALIAERIATQLGEDTALVGRAARLAKCDLLTGMVGEFPELQGTMGRYYALHDGEPQAIADAIAEQYQPRFAGDVLPDSPVGLCVALADKLETLAGLFAIGQLPTGDKDPFALRRHALGVLRMLIEKQLPLSLRWLVDEACAVVDAFVASAPASSPTPKAMASERPARESLMAFFHDRLSGYLRERGYGAHEVAAVMAQLPDTLASVPARLDAVRAFTALPQAQALAAANKRIGNLLRKSDVATGGTAIDAALLGEPAEQALAHQVQVLAPQIAELMSRQDFAGTLTLMAQARTAVDAFFEQVMVMAEDPKVRSNRLALLAQLQTLMNQVADISTLSA